MEMQNVDYDVKIINFENIKNNVKYIFNKIEYFKQLINESKKSSTNIVNINKSQLKSIFDELSARYTFLNSKKTKRFIKKRICRRKHNKLLNNENYYDYRLNDLLQFKNIFGDNETDKILECQVEFNEPLDQYNRGLFDLKQLSDFGQILRKLIILKSNQKDFEFFSKLDLEEIINLIEQRKLEYEVNKKKILESLPKFDRSKDKLNEFFNKSLNETKKFYFGNSEKDSDSELSLEQLIYTRYEWDQFLTNNYDKSKTLPIEWVEPNQEPNEEWSQFIKKE